MVKDIEIKIVDQLSDNYSYLIYSLNKKEALIVDPAESKPIIIYLIDSLIPFISHPTAH